jgi:hypothetical protein
VKSGDIRLHYVTRVPAKGAKVFEYGSLIRMVIGDGGEEKG